MSEPVKKLRFPATPLQLTTAVVVLGVIWLRIKGSFHEEEQSRMLIAVIPGMIGMLCHLMALAFKLFFRHDEKEALLLWRAGLVLQFVGYAAFVIFKLWMTGENH